MLLENLQVRHFGHFENHTLALPPGTRFAILYGENGTGKTTLLNAFRSVLFGIEDKTPYADGDGESPSLSGGFRIGGQTRLDVVRQKRRSKTPFVGSRIENEGTDEERRSPLDEGHFASLLRLPERKLYEKVFGFTLNDLESGAKVLEEATVGELLAGGALGGNARVVRDLITDITTARDGLYRAKAKTPTINQHKSHLESLRAERKRLQMSEPKYHQQQTELQTACKRREALEAEITSLIEEIADVERRIKAYPHWETLKRLEAELALLPTGSPGEAAFGEEKTSFPPIRAELSGAEAKELTTFLEKLETARTAHQALAREVAEAEARLEEQQPDTAVPSWDCCCR